MNQTSAVAPTAPRGWIASLAVYRQPRLVAILLMGFSSGLPLALTGGTLSFWLAKFDVSLAAIGFFSLVGLSYSLKFLWSPLIDRMPIPFLTARFGRRRSWALLIQPLLALAILILGMTDPRSDPAATALAAVIVAFLSASQDIVIDAYRIELLLPEEQGAGAAATQWGYRFGMLAAGAGALYAASFGGWQFAYALMAALMGVGMVTVWLTPEPATSATVSALPHPHPNPPPLAGEGAAGAASSSPPPQAGEGRVGASVARHIRKWLADAVIAPFGDLIERYGAVNLVAIGVFVVLYKFGDALAASMSTPLYARQLGFTGPELATVVKLYGLPATLVGVAVGGFVVARFGVYHALLWCGGLQALSNLLYVVQVQAGHDLTVLALTNGAENLTGFMASAAFVAYLSMLCSREFTATQYALLSALAGLARIFLAAWSGLLVECIGWTPFFLVSTALCVPSLVLLLWIMRRPSAAAVQP